MGDRESLLLALVVLYLLECWVWVPRGAVVLSRWGSRFFRLKHPGNLLGNHRGGWHLAAPLPPLAPVLFCQQFPFSLSPDGVVAYCGCCLDAGDRLRHSGAWWPWEAVQSVSAEGKWIHINGQPFSQAATSGAARSLVLWLQKIQKCPASERSHLIQKCLGSMLDVERVERRWRLFQRHSRLLRGLCHAGFVFLFGATPWLLWRYGAVHVGWWLAGCVVLLTTVITLVFRRAYRTLFPKRGEEAFKRVLTMLLVPPAALRAVDHLGRPLFEEHHVLAVAKCLLAPREFHALARQCLVDLHYPMLPAWAGTPLEATEAEHWFRVTVLRMTEAFLEQCGLSPATLLSPPAPVDGARAFCPRCGTQFLLAEGFCMDCGGRALHSLPRICPI